MTTQTQTIDINQYKIYDVNEESIINDYPYGFRGKCILKVVIEQTKNGQRSKSITIFNNKENNPKYSTYDVGRFYLTKDNRLYSGWIEKNDEKTEVKIYNYSGSYDPIEVYNFEDVKQYLPEGIIKPFVQKEKISDLISQVYEKVEKEYDDLYKDKTEEEIKDFILNPLNWKKGGGSNWNGKDGFYKRQGGYSYFDGKKYNPSVNVSFSCGFISESFNVDNLEDLKLTAKNKQFFEDKARVKLIEFLKVFPRERIVIDLERQQTTLKINDSYTITHI